ncbi:MAG: sigma-70 family RNA polymerase sigma factor [Cyanophyceae cyanobacterium]
MTTVPMQPMLDKAMPHSKGVPSDKSEPDMALEMADDLTLIDQCLAGNRSAFAGLYRRYGQRVRSTLYQLCGETGLDDLVQDVFLRAWRGLPKFRRSASFSTWLYRIAWNVAMDRRKKFARDRQRELTVSDPLDATLPDPSQGASGQWSTLHYQDVVRQALGFLSDGARSVIVLCDLEDIPQKDVAQILNVPVGTVKSRLFSARAALRQELERQGVEL